MNNKSQGNIKDLLKSVKIQSMEFRENQRNSPNFSRKNVFFIFFLIFSIDSYKENSKRRNSNVFS